MIQLTATARINSPPIIGGFSGEKSEVVFLPGHGQTTISVSRAKRGYF
jgi:hypothetical protein